MKYTALLIFILTRTISFSQGDMFSVDLIYGQHLLKNDFNAQFNSEKHFSFSRPIQTVGISLNGAYTRNDRHDYAVHYSYSQVIPQQIQITDSLSGNINGFMVGINMFGKDLLPKSKIANCIVSFGFNTGRFRMSGNDYKQQKNPFFSPTLSIQPKIQIGPIVLSVRGDYSFDISKDGWRSLNFTNKKEGIYLNPLKQTGGIVYLSIGWSITGHVGYTWNLTR